MVSVKICGLTNIDDSLAAIEAGADMLGFNFYAPSPRHILPQDCVRLVSLLSRYRPRVTMVGVFVNATPRQVDLTLEECNLDLAQLSGDEPADGFKILGTRAFKGLRPSDPDQLENFLERYPARNAPPAYLIDAYQPGHYGGTGHTGDWSLAASLAQKLPILLAGGLNPRNVVDAIRKVRPWGVDVASGVEKSPGRKDLEKMCEFIMAAKEEGKE